MAALMAMGGGGLPAGVVPAGQLASGAGAGGSATKVLKLANMVHVSEFGEEDYLDVETDVKEECDTRTQGAVETILVPRPAKDAGKEVKGLGNVYIKFKDVTAAATVFKIMNGRQFDGHSIRASFVDEAAFDAGGR